MRNYLRLILYQRVYNTTIISACKSKNKLGRKLLFWHIYIIFMDNFPESFPLPGYFSQRLASCMTCMWRSVARRPGCTTVTILPLPHPLLPCGLGVGVGTAGSFRDPMPGAPRDGRGRRGAALSMWGAPAACLNTPKQPAPLDCRVLHCRSDKGWTWRSRMTMPGRHGNVATDSCLGSSAVGAYGLGEKVIMVPVKSV